MHNIDMGARGFFGQGRKTTLMSAKFQTSVPLHGNSAYRYFVQLSTLTYRAAIAPVCKQSNN
uniref:Transposase n=1 Tax=Heterorhabditis bacteriophora TaxID=37862 RepID=A0A1I7WTF8_HETBA